jgi:hypothetical protein
MRWRARCHARTNSRRKRRCRILFCPRITMCGQATFICGVCMAILPEQPNADRLTFLICCSRPVWARTVRALALVAEVLHGAPCRFSDPARFSLAHGGKDRHPFPVPIKVYDETIGVLRSAVDKAKLGQQDALFALRKLDAESRRLERVANGPAFDDFISDEFVRSHE